MTNYFVCSVPDESDHIEDDEMQLGLEDLFGEDSDESTTHPDQAQLSSQTINSSGPSSTINSSSGPPTPSGAAVHSDQCQSVEWRPNESISNAARVAGDTQRTKQKRRRNRQYRYRPYGNTTVINIFFYHVH